MSDSAPPTPDAVSLESTLRAFEDGLTTSLSPTAAVTVVDGWAAKIEAAGRPELNGIAALLRQLSNALGASPLDGNVIGTLMQRIGAHTSEAADAADGERLLRLGGLVKAAGIALAGGTRPDETAGISTDASGTPGDPTLRSAPGAPDLSNEGGPGFNYEVQGARVIGSDETPGRTPYNPHGGDAAGS